MIACKPTCIAIWIDCLRLFYGRLRILALSRLAVVFEWCNMRDMGVHYTHHIPHEVL